MIQRNKFSDERYDSMCCYCGALGDTRDHVPSKVLVSRPYPENMHVVNCCFECNQGFSADEVYFACALECITNGSVDIEELKREHIKNILKEKPHLHERIKNSYSVTNGTVLFYLDQGAIERVLLKFARGHAAFEGSAPRPERPDHFVYKPLSQLSEQERRSFFSPPEITSYPEVGSRLFQHVVLLDDNTPVYFWIEVEHGIYAYLVSSTLGAFSVRMVIYDLLAAEVSWLV